MWIGLTELQRGMLKELGGEAFPQDVYIAPGGQGIELRREADCWRLTLAREALLGRALTLLRLHQNEPTGFSLTQTPCYERLGVMVDVARNGVMNPSAFKRLLKHLCLMGYNTVQLYLEDVFELPNYPYFGYGRGRYTRQELQQMDADARTLGIELVPALQTLAHLGQALKWQPMRELVDAGDILLVDEDKTYAFLDAMLATVAECFTSRRVNIGMDEAHMLGLGKYLDRHGFTDRMALMQRHFERVHELAVKHGFAPMLWSDMFFRLATGGEYYAPNATLSQAVGIPSDTTLIYWDYYSTEEAMYDRMLAKHRELSPHTIFAGGAWKWSGFSPCNTFSMHLADMAHAACAKHGIGEVLITLWGDNGAECSPFAVLPTLCHWAELCYAGDAEQLAPMFERSVGRSLSAFLALDQPVWTPDNPSPGRMAVNATKTLLYEDVLMPLFSHRLDMRAYSEHFSCCEAVLAQFAAAEDEWQLLFRANAALCRALALKCRVQSILRPAWAQKDRVRLLSLCQSGLPELHRALDDFAAAFERLWLSENKPAGMDIFDLRIGGQLKRVDTAKQRISDWLAGELLTVEELDEPLLPFDPEAEEKGYHESAARFWHELVSPIHIAQI